MIALILCDGEPPSKGLLLRHLQQASLIVCTDGAVGWVGATGCCPDIVIGDMDSAGMLPECEIINSGPHGEQENSDAEKAILLALERGAERIVVLGATGRRLDHTLGNMWLVARYHRQADLLLVDDFSQMRVISEPYRLSCDQGAMVSLVPLTPDVTLDTEGLRWPLHGALEQGTRGLSNEATAEEVFIDLHSGLLAVITAPGVA